MIQLVASSGFITVNKVIAKEYGLEAAVFLGEIASTQVYWESHGGLNEDGMFFETAEQIEENTSLTTYQQGKASKVLEEVGLLVTKRKGVPAKKFYAVNVDGVQSLFQNKFLKNLETRNQKTKKLDSQFFEVSNKNRDNKKREIRIDKNITVLESSLSEPVKEKVLDFLAYRDEIKKPYKSERSIQSFVRQVEKQEQIHGSLSVINCIDMSMQNGWLGVFWNKIEESKPTSKIDMIDKWAADMERRVNEESGIF